MGCFCSKDKKDEQNTHVRKEEPRFYAVPVEEESKVPAVIPPPKHLKSSMKQHNSENLLAEPIQVGWADLPVPQAQDSADESFYITLRDAIGSAAFFRSNATENFMSLDSHNLVTSIYTQIDEFANSGSEPLLVRASRDILGLAKESVYMHELYESFKEFFTNQVVKACSEDTSEYIADVALAGPLDLFFLEAIAYNNNYAEFCQKLTRRVIHRQPDSSQSYLPFPLYDFAPEEWQFDKQSTLWVTHSQLQVILNIICRSITVTKSLNLFEIRGVLLQCKKQLNISKVVVRHSTPVPKHHKLYKHSDKSLQQVDQLISNHFERLEDGFKLAISFSLPALDNSAFLLELISEYKRFLLMQYFSLELLVPSALVSFLWHTHMGYTQHYLRLCQDLYGKVLPFIYCNSPECSQDLENTYADTVTFYTFLFRQQPDAQVWPSATERFLPKNSQYCWASVLRLTRYFESEAKHNPRLRELAPDALLNLVLKGYADERVKQFFMSSRCAFDGTRGKRRKVYARQYYQGSKSSSDEDEFKSIGHDLQPANKLL